VSTVSPKSPRDRLSGSCSSGGGESGRDGGIGRTDEGCGWGEEVREFKAKGYGSPIAFNPADPLVLFITQAFVIVALSRLLHPAAVVVAAAAAAARVVVMVALAAPTRAAGGGRRAH
jgi:hypothetical protein